MTINADAACICINNNSSSIVNNVYLSLSSDNDWGPNQLEGYIEPGESFIWQVNPGIWDILVENTNDGYWELRDKNVPVGTTYSASLIDKKMLSNVGKSMVYK